MSTGIGYDSALSYPLFEALTQRRSRRFPVGAVLPAGPNAYRSSRVAQSLSAAEESLLLAAATGRTGRNLADMHYADQDGRSTAANTMLQFSGRTFASACASHATEVFYTNDSGTFVAPLRDIAGGAGLSAAELVGETIGRVVQLSDKRMDLPPVDDVVVPFNRWNVNQPGSTVFVPITDITREYINLVMTYFTLGVYIYDDIGEVHEPVARWAQSGRLDRSRALPLSEFETKTSMMTTAVEGAFICQNLSLATQAIGLGGWTFSASPLRVVLGGTSLTPGLGFRFHTPTAIVKPRLDQIAPASYPIGRDSVFESSVPPYFESMSDAVQSVFDAKWATDGIYLNGSSSFDPAKADMARVPRTEKWVVEAAQALCEHIWSRFGRFPATVDPLQSTVWFQAHHLDTDFYDLYYPADSYHDQIRDHDGAWHGDESGLA